MLTNEHNNAHNKNTQLNSHMHTLWPHGSLTTPTAQPLWWFVYNRTETTLAWTLWRKKKTRERERERVTSISANRRNPGRRWPRLTAKKQRPQTTCNRIKYMNVLQSKYMSIPTGHVMNRRFSRPKSKSAQPKGRRFPSRRSSRCWCVWLRLRGCQICARLPCEN